MKKIIIIILLCFIVTGCNNTYSINFNEQIDTKINFSFSKNEYQDHENVISNNISDQIRARIGEMRPLTDSYDEMFNKISYKENGYSFQGEYEYSYTYSNFKNNSILDRCFEYSAIGEDDEKIYVYLKGSSDCAPLELKVKADKRMLKNNAEDKIEDEYIWKVKEKNNDIQFYISKVVVDKPFLSIKSIIYIVIAFISIILIVYLKKRTQPHN